MKVNLQEAGEEEEGNEKEQDEEQVEKKEDCEGGCHLIVIMKNRMLLFGKWSLWFGVIDLAVLVCECDGG